MKIYNLLGQEVATLLSENLTPGKYEISLNAENMPKGTYVYALASNCIKLVNKMMLVKVELV
jgi:hypothetical protein